MNNDGQINTGFNKYRKLATDVANKIKSAAMIKEVPIEIKDKEGIVRKDKMPVVVRRLFSRTIKDEQKQKASNTEKTASISSADIEGVQRDLDKILSRIYEENKSYFPHGLYKELYNGDDDILEVIKDEETGSPAGFRGVQVRTNPENKRVAYYSIGVLPEFRGKGLAEKAMVKSLLEEGGKFDMNAYTVNRENRPSLFLYNKLLEKLPEMDLQLQLFR